VLGEAVRDIDDVSELPAEVRVWQQFPDGTVQRSPGAPSWLPVDAELRKLGAGADRRQRTISRGGQSYVLRTQRRSDGIVVQAAWSDAEVSRERRRLVTAVVIAELVGLLLSAVLGLLLARRAIAPLAQAIARQRRFVADASHELRTPLTLLTTRAQLLERSLRPKSTSRVADAHAQAEALVVDARRMGDVVSDLLFSASLDAEPARQQPVDLRRVARDSVEAARLHAQQRSVALTGPPPHGDATAAWVVMGAAVPLRRVVDALVDNAVGHAPEGGTVLVEVLRDTDSIVLRVSDDGPGIDPSVAPRLFERFAHAPGPANGSSRASFGLGLALVREIVEAHRGTVSGSDGATGGAVFEVRLPRATDV
jgi:signal transduction histidine kinase